MKVVIVFNHPYEGSYCNAVLGSVTKGLQKAQHEIDLIHLDKDNFNPVMTASDLKGFVERKPVDPQVMEYRQRLEQAEHLILIFPIWWELMPAMTKGFIDKVIFPGVAYDHPPKGVLFTPLFKKIKGVTMITTMNSAGIVYRLIFGNAIQRSVLRGTFWKTGYKNRRWINLTMVKMISEEKRRKRLQKLEQGFAKLR